MKIKHAALALAFLSLPFAALALDPGPAIKVKQLMKTSNSWNGAPLAYPEGKAEITGLVIEIAPGAETGWHLHPGPSFGMVLQGTLEIRTRDGQMTQLKAGDGISEVINTEHNGRNAGADEVRLVVFYAGVVGKPLTVNKP